MKEKMWMMTRNCEHATVREEKDDGEKMRDQEV